MTSPFELSGRVALVTGSSRGIGPAIADGLARSGAAVILNGRDESRLARALESACRRIPGAAWSARAFDVTDEAAVKSAIAQCESAAGPIDILVNNAGMQLRKPLAEISLEDWRCVIDTDLTSAFLVGRAAARRMIPRGRGKIINVCSVQSELARPGVAAYTAAKGGLRNLTRAMAADSREARSVPARGAGCRYSVVSSDDFWMNSPFRGCLDTDSLSSIDAGRNRVKGKRS